MEAVVVHSGFDGLKFTIQADISPELRENLASAKKHAKEIFSDCVIDFGSVSLSVTSKGARGFTTHTGDHGAVWLFQGPEDPIPNNPGITVDFRAFGLAVSGLEGAEAHFRECMEAFGINYIETQLRVTRADFAAPWFEPNRECLIVPPGTKVTERAEGNETETVSSGSRVVGLRAGSIANRQLANNLERRVKSERPPVPRSQRPRCKPSLAVRVTPRLQTTTQLARDEKLARCP